VADEQWAQQKGLQKGLALSSLGQVNIEKKDNTQAVENLKAAAPLLKPDDGSYARNQYRLGFALLNLKRKCGSQRGIYPSGFGEQSLQSARTGEIKSQRWTGGTEKRAP